jgi:DNA-binding CsgD family transcriptional regulator
VKKIATTSVGRQFVSLCCFPEREGDFHMTQKPTYEQLEQRVRELERSEANCKRAEEQLKQQAEFLHLVIESLPHPFYVIDAHDYTIKMANLAAHAGKLSKGVTCHALTHNSDKPCASKGHPCPLQIVRKTRQPITVEHIHYDKDGNPRNVEVHAYPILDSRGRVYQIIESCIDITERKQAEEARQKAYDELEQRVQQRTAELAGATEELKRELSERKRAQEALQRRKEELKAKAQRLEELNITLKVLLKQREQDKAELEEKVFSNVKQLVLPQLETLRHSGLDAKQIGYVSIIESNLDNIVSPFSRRLSSKYLGLTPREIQIADLVKVGKKSTEIAQFLNMTPRAVEFHRENLRKKFGLKHRRASLRSYLLSMGE